MGLETDVIRWIGRLFHPKPATPSSQPDILDQASSVADKTERELNQGELISSIRGDLERAGIYPDSPEGKNQLDERLREINNSWLNN